MYTVPLYELLDDEYEPPELELLLGGVYGSVYQPRPLYASTSDFGAYVVLPSVAYIVTTGSVYQPTF